MDDHMTDPSASESFGALRLPYLSLPAALVGRIESDRREHRVNPYRFDDADMVRRSEKRHDDATLIRPAFGRDIEKIMNLPAYSRYNDKTQVFSLRRNDDLCRRALHVQLVSRISRDIGAILGLNVDLVEAIALGHDIGHTPFGHAGERMLDELLFGHAGLHFHHNVHSVRVLSVLYDRNISLQTLDGALCHNGEFAQQQFEMSDLSTFSEFDDVVASCYTDAGTIISHLRPATLEGCVVRLCDMIAYLGKDRQDARDAGLIDDSTRFTSTYIGTDNAQIINNLTVDIIEQSYGANHICLSAAAFEDLKVAKRENYDLIYDNEGVSRGRESDIEAMFGAMYDRLLADVVTRDESSPIFRHHVAHICRKSSALTVEKYLAQDPNMVVADYLASMTDSYFIALYAHLFPSSAHHLEYRGYFDDLP